MININQNIQMIKNQNHLGGICMILSVLFFSLMDILIKITDEYDVGQVMFSRALFGLIPIFFLIPKKNKILEGNINPQLKIELTGVEDETV